MLGRLESSSYPERDRVWQHLEARYRSEYKGALAAAKKALAEGGTGTTDGAGKALFALDLALELGDVGLQDMAGAVLEDAVEGGIEDERTKSELLGILGRPGLQGRRWAESVRSSLGS